MNILIYSQKHKFFLEFFKMSFNGQLNMFFDKIISYTSDLHFKQNILNPLNIMFWSNGSKNEFFSLQPFLLKFQNFKFFVQFGVSSSSYNEHILL